MVMLRAKLAISSLITDLPRKPRTPRRLRLFSTDSMLLTPRNAIISIDLMLYLKLLLLE